MGADPVDLPQATAATDDVLTTPVSAYTKPATAPSTGDEMKKLQRDPVEGAPVTALPRELVESHLAKLVAKLSPDVQAKIHLLGANDEIPGRSEPMGTDTLGLYRNGDVYINADMVRSRADLEDTISHEVFGHLGNQADIGGLSGQFEPGRYQNRMLNLLSRAGGLEGMKALAKREGVWSSRDPGNKLNGGDGLSAYFRPTAASRPPTRPRASWMS